MCLVSRSAGWVVLVPLSTRPAPGDLTRGQIRGQRIERLRGLRSHLCTAEAGVSSPAATWIRNILRSLQSIVITPRVLSVPRVQCMPAPVGGVWVAAVHQEVAEHQHVPRPRRHGRRGLQAPGRLVHVVVARAGGHVPLHVSCVTCHVSCVTCHVSRVPRHSTHMRHVISAQFLCLLCCLPSLRHFNPAPTNI